MNIESASPLFVKTLIPSSAAKMTTVRPEVYPAQSNSVVDSEILAVDNGIQVQSSDVSNILMENSLSAEKPDLQVDPAFTDFAALPARTFVLDEIEPEFMPDLSSVKNTKRWSIGALASPTVNSRVITNKNNLSEMLAASENSVPSYSGGVAVSYKLNRRLTVQAGLYYSSIGQELEGISTFSGFEQYDYTKGASNFDVLTTSGLVKANNSDVFLIAPGKGDRIMTAYTNDVFDPLKANLKVINNSLYQRFSFLELPVVLRYKFIDKAVDFNLVGGLSYNMLMDNSVYTFNEGEKYFVGETDGLNPVSVSSSLGMGMEYSFSEKLSFNIEPTLRYYLNPFSNMSGSESHPYSFGLFSGLSYKF